MRFEFQQNLKIINNNEILHVLVYVHDFERCVFINFIDF
jgi:hypothetical protein